ncbi:class III lanthionine synthetase LanKC [Streptomyces sp. TLI_171]|uniref:class III lanthionine synthetase LanKC n=1 Tax=Streptomyces sp. TLI_171 TaxID=1938859 RepID=UPI000C5F2700|nr:class III lanthionine synthetase LanKC [Streptomyces sp. TLI_171]RKE17392.1 serine/threonine protein kinase [Streptomyces sp. TLI_171]
MDMRYEAYSYADPVFYDSPVAWAARDEFPELAEPVPAGWTRSLQEVWAGFRPDGPTLPDQGWKIHVSARLDTAQRVLDTVRPYCFEHRVAYKFLRGPALVQTQNAKYASRGSSGKFMTLYPVGDAQLERCLDDLDAALDGAPGPYVLSDLRWRRGPLYLRYGAFTEQFCRDEQGELVLAFREPSGRLRPDVRRAVFELPDWAPVPAVLADAVAGAGRSSVDDFPYTVERALHFSNAGGIYLARPAGGGEQVVLKEARPHAGLDQRGEDATTRLVREQRVLEALSGLDCVPRVLGDLTAWEHRFLVQEYVEGEGLHRWFGRRYPLVRPDADRAAVTAYREEALAVLAEVERGLRAIHARGIVFGDLHPRNLIVRPDGSVAFVDFELASPAAAFVRPALGAAGFAAPAGLTGFAVDEHALAALRLWAFLPLLPLTALHPAKDAALRRAARARFALTTAQLPDPVPAVPAAARPVPRPEAELAAVEDLFDGSPASWPRLRDGLVGAVTGAATPERPDRLFPGDPAQFTHDGLGLAYGAAGVLWALHTVGAEPDPAHLDWLVEAVRRQPCRPGLFVGAHGTAWVLDLLGRREAALELMDRLGKDDPEGYGTGLSSGLAGIGLAQLYFARATGDRALLAAAADSADRAVAALRQDPPSGPGARVGLLHGPTGTALLLLRMFGLRPDPALLDLARAALDQDLARCIVAEDGTLQVDDGSRVLPYLETGSAGIGAVADALLRHRPDPELADRLALIRAAAEPEFIVQPGLFNGRAGLIALLAAGGDRPDPRTADLIRRHVRRLAWHVLPRQDRPVFPGEQLLRLSMDLATGTAGVLTALAAVHDGTPPMPWWPAGPA